PPIPISLLSLHDALPISNFLDLGRIFGEPNLTGCQELFHNFLISVIRSEDELLVRTDDAVVKRGPSDNLLRSILKIDFAIDDDRDRKSTRLNSSHGSISY